MQGISTFLWFNTEAEEAAKFYTSIFKNSKINRTSYYGEGMPMPKGSVLVVDFELNGQPFQALNGGPTFKFNEAISLMVHCDNQQEVDLYWEKLLANGGQESQCGWLKDKYGLSWQVAPTMLLKLISDPDKEKANRVLQTMMTMKKIDLKKIEEAAESAVVSR